MTDEQHNLEEMYLSLHRLEVQVLKSLGEASGPLEECSLAETTGLSDQEVRTACSWLLMKEMIEESSVRVLEEVALTEKGLSLADEGLPEIKIINELRKGSHLAMKDLGKVIPEEEIRGCVGNLKKAGVIEIAEGGVIVFADDGNRTRFLMVQDLLIALAKSGSVAAEDLEEEKRSLVKEFSRKRGAGKGLFRVQERRFPTYRLTEWGSRLSEKVKGQSADMIGLSQLTREMLEDGSWRQASFRSYDLSVRAPRLIPGRTHPYKAFLDSVKRKFISLGFQQMKGSLVETEFWNMDALYMPQFHPARKVHDVYFVKSPTHASEIQKPFGENVLSVCLTAIMQAVITGFIAACIPYLEVIPKPAFVARTSNFTIVMLRKVGWQ